MSNNQMEKQIKTAEEFYRSGNTEFKSGKGKTIDYFPIELYDEGGYNGIDENVLFKMMEQYAAQFQSQPKEQGKEIVPSSVPSVEEIEKKAKELYPIKDLNDLSEVDNQHSLRRAYIQCYKDLIGASTHGYSEIQKIGDGRIIINGETYVNEKSNRVSPPLDDMGKKPMGTDIVPMDEDENKWIVKEDMICPANKQHCDDECCTVGSICNLHPSDAAPVKESLAIEEVKGSDAVEFGRYLNTYYEPHDDNSDLWLDIDGDENTTEELYLEFLKDQSKGETTK